MELLEESLAVKRHIRLEGRLITASSGIELVDGSEESVCILPSPSVILVDVGKNVSLRRTPETLQEAKDLRSLRFTIWT